MPILPGRDFISIESVTLLTLRVHSGCIDRVLVSQRAVQSRTVPAPLPQGTGQQLLQPYSLVAVTIHL